MSPPWFRRFLWKLFGQCPSEYDFKERKGNFQIQIPLLINGAEPHNRLSLTRLYCQKFKSHRSSWHKGGVLIQAEWPDESVIFTIEWRNLK